MGRRIMPGLDGCRLNYKSAFSLLTMVTGLLTLSDTSALSISTVASATVTDSDGSEVTVTDGSVTFSETSTGSGGVLCDRLQCRGHLL